MSTYRKEGKDIIIFATAEDHKEPSNVKLPEPEPQAGLILPNGEINWNCPCLGGMATGPCGVEFREAFSCFHNSEAEPKGSDCYDAFKEMHLCMAEYPQLYNRYNEDDEEDEKDLNIELTKEERELISDPIPKGASDKTKSSSSSSSGSKIEEKPSEKKGSVHTEPKKTKSTPASGTLNINA